MRQIETTYVNNSSNTQVKILAPIPDDGGQETEILNVYPNETFQTFLGFGGAFTESAGCVLSRMPAAVQGEMLDAYFGPGGLGYTLGRAPIDGCDFSLGGYSAVTDPADEKLDSFTLRRDEQYILPLCRAAQMREPGLRWMLSPWSPPAFMKSNGERDRGGKLLPEYRARWAEYLCRYVEEYRARGLAVFALSVQNEPNAVQPWDSCVYTAEEERDFVRDFLAPALARRGLTNLSLTVWDHNKERLFDRVDTVCADPAVNAAVGAAGFHWYSGDHFEAVSLTARKYPDKTLIFTEGCIEYSKFSPESILTNAQRYAHELIGGFNAGMHAFLDWNLFLDTRGGPNHKANYCDAPIMADPEAGTFRKNLSYDYLGHFTRYIAPGAVRVGTTRYTDRVELTAFRNGDGVLAAVVLNPGREAVNCFLRVSGALYPLTLAPESVSTLLLAGGEWR